MVPDTRSKTGDIVPLEAWHGPAWAKLLIALGATAPLALAARVDVPMVPVPMSLQTYAVLVIAALSGPRWGGLTLSMYLVEAALGLPVLAGGSSGVGRLLGPTGGYLLGFLAATIAVGMLARRGWTADGAVRALAAMLLGHAMILVLGVARLSWVEGYDLSRAFADGATPFLAGAVVKSVLAALTVAAVRRGLAGRS